LSPGGAAKILAQYNALQPIEVLHHAKRSFEEEFVFLVKSSGVDYDPRYVFG
jgi:hypothetical protein